MNTNDWMSVVQLISVLLAILVAVSSLRYRSDKRACTLAKMEADIEHIKKTVDSVAALWDELAETRVEVKEAHRRIDEHLKYDHGKTVKT